MHLSSRHRRHLEAVRNSLGGHPVLERLTDALVEEPLAWTPPDRNDASRLDAHTRGLVLLGAARALKPSRTALEHVDRLEVTLIEAALHTWLPRLGEPGQRVAERMEKRGIVAVGAHLLQELCSLHGGDIAIPTAGALKDQVLLLDALVTESMALGEPGAEVLASKSTTAVRRLSHSMEPSAGIVGWDAVAALWIATLTQLGGGMADLTSTKSYTRQEVDLADAFGLLDD
ncbi:MAG: hypothetical protein H6734_14740 [Alphaproteobacteria bacterium]|nr:hypothetical protein [Alphaproteobacteria bacterium]